MFCAFLGTIQFYFHAFRIWSFLFGSGLGLMIITLFLVLLFFQKIHKFFTIFVLFSHCNVLFDFSLVFKTRVKAIYFLFGFAVWTRRLFNFRRLGGFGDLIGQSSISHEISIFLNWISQGF